MNFRNALQLRCLTDGDISALADAYVRGEIEIEGAIADVIELVAELASDPVVQGEPSIADHLLRHISSRWLHRPRSDADHVHLPYDLCDEFFALWLDPRRVHSCASLPQSAMTLAQAQEARLEHICRKLQLQPGQLLLDVDAGWGNLLLWAAEHHGVQGMGITLSRDQHAYVNSLINQKGLQGRVAMRLLDYRDMPMTPRFDRIASVGMFEHVDSAQLSGYFNRLRTMLKPGGLLLNHGITAGGAHKHQRAGGFGDPVDRHMFAGEERAHVSRVAHSLSAGGLELLDAENLSPCYARTLRASSTALEGQLERARELTSESTVRAWRLYLAGCAVAFERGWISVHQLLASRPAGSMSDTALRRDQLVYPYKRRHVFVQPSAIAGELV
ncbi:MAG: SAM-dependent methyltransferase [Comamonadaceae bacterium]|nr:SAM-dependent methyltransferase [Comamonadaceae bacterium]